MKTQRVVERSCSERGGIKKGRMKRDGGGGGPWRRGLKGEGGIRMTGGKAGWDEIEEKLTLHADIFDQMNCGKPTVTETADLHIQYVYLAGSIDLRI
jgi:hypothetical protein